MRGVSHRSRTCLQVSNPAPPYQNASRAASDAVTRIAREAKYPAGVELLGSDLMPQSAGMPDAQSRLAESYGARPNVGIDILRSRLVTAVKIATQPSISGLPPDLAPTRLWPPHHSTEEEVGFIGWRGAVAFSCERSGVDEHARYCRAHTGYSTSWECEPVSNPASAHTECRSAASLA